MLRASLVCALGLSVWLTTSGVQAFNGKVVIEIDALAEQRLDVASARRLIALELSDIEVPAHPHQPQRAPGLFFRVLGDARGEMRIELWERGEFYGARVVSGTATNRQLGARRVALGAAELLRGLRDRRNTEARRKARAQRRERLQLAEQRLRTLEGPSALRASYGSAVLPAEEFWLFGPSLALELHVSERTRVDLAASFYGGFATRDLNFEWSEVSVGPARRFQLTQAFDLDLGARAAAALVRFDDVSSVDGMKTSAASWTARASAMLRLEPRLLRHLRLSFGMEAGALLREIAAQPRRYPEAEARVLGLWLGADIGLVVTPLP